MSPVQSLGHHERCLTAYKRLERLDTTSDGGTTPKMQLGAVAAVDAKRVRRVCAHVCLLEKSFSGALVGLGVLK